MNDALLSRDTVASLVHMARRHGVTRMSVTVSDASVEFALDHSAGAVSVAPAQMTPEKQTIRALSPGLFRPAIETLPARLKQGDILGFVEAGATRQALRMEGDGTLAGFLVAPGALVGWGTPVAELQGQG